MARFDVVLNRRSFLEGARWRAGRVWVSDCYACEVLSVREDGTDARVEATIEGQPSGLGFLPDGRRALAAAGGRGEPQRSGAGGDPADRDEGDRRHPATTRG
jgi:hypothetical protein